MKTISAGTVALCFTSPPYALTTQKAYGNETQADYVAWLRSFVPEIRRVLSDTGSFCLNLGGAWEPGQPTKSLYLYDVLAALVRQDGFHLAQEFFWYNPSKLPSPAEWVNVRRVRVKDAVEVVWWLTKTPHVKADNRRVLVAYSEAMQKLLRAGGMKGTTRPSGHNLREGKFAQDRGGAIPSNLLSFPNTDSKSLYLRECRARGVKPHPARFPPALPNFFIRFLTEPGDLVLDPFAGSNVTGAVAESLGRRWVSCEVDEAYLRASALRFPHAVFHDAPSAPSVPGEPTCPPQARTTTV